jgi:flagellar protein FlgJ
VSQPTAPIASSAGVSMDTSRLASKENLDAAGKRFEAIFVGMMLKSMRTAGLGEGLFDSKASQQFRDMQDQQLAQTMAAHAPIGIGKAMTDFLAKAAPVESTASFSSFPGEGRGPVAMSPVAQSTFRETTETGPRPSPGSNITKASGAGTP